MKAPIAQAQARAVIAESAGWNAKELPVLPDLTLMWADINAWHESKTPYPKPTAAINETVIAMLQAYGAACAAHAREMALSDSELLDFVEAHPHLTLRNHKKRWSFVGLTNYEYTTFDTARAAIKATLEASEY